MYRVAEYFTDLQDNNHEYHAGDKFPRDGVEVTVNRIKELSTSANRRGIALIEEVDETDKPDKSITVDDEPRKRVRKRKENE